MKSTNKKLMLIPLDYGKKSLVPEEIVYARVNPEYGTMHIGKPALAAMSMNGMFYRLFYDADNHIIAWQIRGGLDKDALASKTWKLAKADKSQQLVVSVKRIIEAFKMSGHKSLKVEIQKWNARKDSVLEDGDYYFIDLSNPKQV